MIKFNKKLSIIIPVYNEKNTIETLLRKIYKVRDIKKEIAPKCFKFIDHLILYVFIIVVYLKVYGVIP